MKIKKLLFLLILITFIIVFIYRYFFVDEKKLSWSIINFANFDTCSAVIDTFYSDDKYIYSFPNPCYAKGLYIVFSNGKIYSIKNAIKKDKVDVDDLIIKGIKIYKEEI